MEETKGLLKEILIELKALNENIKSQKFDVSLENYEFWNTYRDAWITTDNLVNEVLKNKWRIFATTEIPQPEEKNNKHLITLFRPKSAE